MPHATIVRDEITDCVAAVDDIPNLLITLTAAPESGYENAENVRDTTDYTAPAADALCS